MTDEELYGTIAPTPRNPYVGAVADAAGGFRDFLDQARVPNGVPLVGGMGAGELLVGQAPEEIDRWAYGMSPFVDKDVPGYSGLRGIPEIQTKRTGPLADTLFLGADAAGAGLGVRALGRAGGRQAMRSFNNAIDDTGRDASRRQFVKNAGVIGAGAAAAAATPDLLKGLAKGVAKIAPAPETVAARVAKNALGSFPEYTARIRSLDALRNPVLSRVARDVLDNDDAYQALTRKQQQKWDEAAAAWDEKQLYLAPEDRAYDTFADYMEANGSGGYLDDGDFALDEARDIARQQVTDRWYNYRNAEVDAVREANPEWAKMMDDFDAMEADWYQARTDLYSNEHLPSREAADRRLAEIDAQYHKAAKEKFGVLYNDADVLEHFKSGKGNYVDPVTGVEAVIKYTPEGDEVLEWTRAGLMKGQPQSWAYRHWVPDETLPDQEQLIEEILKSESFRKGTTNPGLREFPF